MIVHELGDWEHSSGPKNDGKQEAIMFYAQQLGWWEWHNEQIFLMVSAENEGVYREVIFITKVTLESPMSIHLFTCLSISHHSQQHPQEHHTQYQIQHHKQHHPQHLHHHSNLMQLIFFLTDINPLNFDLALTLTLVLTPDSHGLLLEMLSHPKMF